MIPGIERATSRVYGVAESVVFARILTGVILPRERLWRVDRAIHVKALESGSPYSAPLHFLINDLHVVRPWDRAKPADPRVPSPPSPSALETSELTLQGS
jgi:hypothetical protein